MRGRKSRKRQLHLETPLPGCRCSSSWLGCAPAGSCSSSDSRPCLSTDPLLTPSLHSSPCLPTPCSLPSSGLRGQLFLPTAASHCSVPYTLFLSPFPPCHLSSLSLSLLSVCLPAPYTLTHSLLPFLSPSLPPQLDFLVLNSSSGKNSRPGSTRVFFSGQNQGVQTRAKCAQEKRRKRKLI